MNEENVFKVVIVALMVLMKMARWPTRHLIGWKVSWPALKKNPIDTVMLFVCGLTWSAALLAYLFLPQQIAFCHLELPGWLRWAGAALAVAATVLLRWADYSLGNNLSVSLQIKEDHTLITSGPYRWLRHPIYASAILFSVAMFLVSANWLVGLCFVGAIGLLCGSRIPREEKMMIGQFGDRYRQYMRRTGRLLPRIVRPARSRPDRGG